MLNPTTNSIVQSRCIYVGDAIKVLAASNLGRKVARNVETSAVGKSHSRKIPIESGCDWPPSAVEKATNPVCRDGADGGKSASNPNSPIKGDCDRTHIAIDNIARQG